MSRRKCLDTSAYGHFKRGEASAVAAIGGAKWIGVPAVVLGELRTGFALTVHAEKNEMELHQFLAHPLVHILDVDDAASSFYAEIMAALRRAGTPLPSNDIWIASVAAREGAMVVTYDEHFRSIQRIGYCILSEQ